MCMDLASTGVDGRIVEEWIGVDLSGTRVVVRKESEVGQTVEYEYTLREQVTVRPLGMSGVIDGLFCDSSGPQYRVVYWNDGERRREVVYAWELEHARTQ